MLHQACNYNCKEEMRAIPGKYFDLAVVDPPYGIGVENNKGNLNRSKHASHKKVKWDSASLDGTGQLDEWTTKMD